MITFSQYLTEARTAPLYHSTKLAHADKIIGDDVLYASEQHEGATKGKKVIFFTRSLKHAKHIYGSSDRVIFEFDQLKLNSRYKISPIKNHDRGANSLHKPQWMTGYLGGNEFEEIVTRNITNVNDYITKIYITKETKDRLSKYPDLATDDRIEFV